MKDKEKNKALEAFSNSILKVEQEDKIARDKILKEGIKLRENNDKSNILTSKIINDKFSKIREMAGLSAFVGTSGKIKSPKLRRTNFLHLLARELLLIGYEELKNSGSIISLKKLKEYFNKTRDNWKLKSNDIKEGIDFLEVNNFIPLQKRIDNEVQVIYFRPIELSLDIYKILKASIGLDGLKSELLAVLGWNEQRLQFAIEHCVELGIAYEEENYVYFPYL